MAAGRFVVLGLALARSPWFRSVAQWANSASIAVEFVKCMSPVELRAHLASGRPFSAVLVDAGLPALDRDLIDEARHAGCAVIVVDDLRITRDWAALGASAVMNPVFDRKDLVDVLSQHSSMITRGDALPGEDAEAPVAGWRARVAMVCGAGGTGASTASIALAQGLGDDVRQAGMVLLADLALHADQAMLHDARDVVPGVQELVEAHRTRRPSTEEVRDLTFAVQERGYQLLLGLRRSRNWASIRPRAFEAAFDSLRRSWRVVVCDTDAELEGEDEGGSIEVEERHVMARTVAANADVVFAVGLPGMKGLHSLTRVITELLDHGTAPERIVPIVNRVTKSQRGRAELSAALTALLRPRVTHLALATPVFLPERRVDEALRDGVRVPPQLSTPLVGAFNAVVERSGRLGQGDGEPRPVEPGTVGSWSTEAESSEAAAG